MHLSITSTFIQLHPTNGIPYPTDRKHQTLHYKKHTKNTHTRPPRHSTHLITNPDNTRHLILRTQILPNLQITIYIVYVLLGISPASNCSWPTFRNPVSVPSSKAGCTLHPAFEDGTDTGFRNVSQLQFDAGEVPERTYTKILTPCRSWWRRKTNHFE